MKKASPRGILSPDRLVLSPRQRQEYLRLRARGVDEATAREMAFAFNKRQDAADHLAVQLACDAINAARDTCHADPDDPIEVALKAVEAVEKKDPHSYERKFVQSAKEALSPDQFDALHVRARGRAGGVASSVARSAPKDPDSILAKLWDERNELVARLHALDQNIAKVPVSKAITPSGTIHVDVPIKGGRPPKKRKPKAKPSDRVLSQKAQTNPMGPGLTQTFTRPNNNDEHFHNAAALVAGMDYELRLGADGPEDARSRASRALATDLKRYGNAFVPDADLAMVSGFDIDVGSGQARQAGYLGLDLYPYDHGTALCDVSMGLPFSNSSVRSIRLVNSLEYMPDFADDATPLLLEVQRVLNYGGKLFYEGVADLNTLADFNMLPGLVLISHEDTTPALPTQDPTASELHKQVFERIRVRVPRIYGADPEWMGADENTPDDVAFALDAMGIDAPAQYAMADLIGKSEGATPPKGVQSACKRGLELAPEYGGQGLTDGAKSRARSMASGNSVSLANLKKMRAWFARHTEEKTSSPPSPGYVAWLLWGGDAGKKWAESQVDALEKASLAKAEWDEGSHPRDENGRFGEGAGFGGKERGITENGEVARDAKGKSYADHKREHDEHFARQDAHLAAAKDAAARGDHAEAKKEFQNAVKAGRAAERSAKAGAKVHLSSLSHERQQEQASIRAQERREDRGVSKGKKPLGAAFSHARASGKKKDPKSVRRRANRYLTENGHDPIGKAEQLDIQVDGGSLFTKQQDADQQQWEQLVTSVIYSPNELDTDGEYIEPHDLVALAHQAMVDRVPIKLEHAGDPIDAQLVESYIAPISFDMTGPQGPQSVRKGAWVGTFKINDKAVWKAVVKGQLRGVSVGGVAAGEYR